MSRICSPSKLPFLIGISLRSGVMSNSRDTFMMKQSPRPREVRFTYSERFGVIFTSSSVRSIEQGRGRHRPCCGSLLPLLFRRNRETLQAIISRVNATTIRERDPSTEAANGRLFLLVSQAHRLLSFGRFRSKSPYPLVEKANGWYTTFVVSEYRRPAICSLR